MKKALRFSSLIILAIIFGACSNMQVGFEEDSVFYTKPKTKSLEPIKVIQIPKTKPKEDVENETTFSYSSDDGE